MESLHYLINSIVLAVITLCVITLAALWRIRHKMGRLGLHIAALIAALFVAFGFYLYGQDDMAVTPLEFQITRIIGLVCVMATLSALCLYLLGLKNGDK